MRFKNLRLTAIASALWIQSLSASELPVLDQVRQGDVSLSETADLLNVTQTSQAALVDWDSFNIGGGREVQISMPSSDSVSVNRVTGSDLSSIHGRLSSNGHVVLLNPNGIQMSSSAVIDVAALTVSTANIDQDAFAQGDVSLLGATGSMLLDGQIDVAPGGLLVALAPDLTVDADINAASADAFLLAGQDAELILTDDGRVSVNVSGVRAQDSVTFDGAYQGRDLVVAAVNSDDVVNAAMNVGDFWHSAMSISAVKDGGVASISGTVQAHGSVVLSGQLNSDANIVASDVALIASEQAEVAGRIELSGSAAGKLLATADQLSINSDINLGSQAGSVAWLGGAAPDQRDQLAAARLVTIDTTTRIRGDAASQSVIQYATQSLFASGRVDLSGPGFIEVSAPSIQNFDMANYFAGTGGNLLIDPDRILIRSALSDGGSSSADSGFDLVVEASALNLALTTQNVTYEATQIIDLRGARTDTSVPFIQSGTIAPGSPPVETPGYDLTLRSGGSIVSDSLASIQMISNGTRGNLTLEADYDGDVSSESASLASTTPANLSTSTNLSAIIMQGPIIMAGTDSNNPVLTINSAGANLAGVQLTEVRRLGDNTISVVTSGLRSADTGGDSLTYNLYESESDTTADVQAVSFTALADNEVDSDADGTTDNLDAFDFDPTETTDTDGDGVGDNSDAFPNDGTETADTDGDGVGDNSDAFPNDASETVDTDGDGVGDNADAFPLDPSRSAGAVDTDGDGVADNLDAFPNDASESADSDGDGVGDNADAFPNDAAETTDTDGDGVGDNADEFPSDPSRSSLSGTEINLDDDGAQSAENAAQAELTVNSDKPFDPFAPGLIVDNKPTQETSSNPAVTPAEVSVEQIVLFSNSIEAGQLPAFSSFVNLNTQAPEVVELANESNGSVPTGVNSESALTNAPENSQSSQTVQEQLTNQSVQSVQAFGRTLELVTVTVGQLAQLDGETLRQTGEALARAFEQEGKTALLTGLRPDVSNRLSLPSVPVVLDVQSSVSQSAILTRVADGNGQRPEWIQIDPFTGRALVEVPQELNESVPVRFQFLDQGAFVQIRVEIEPLN